MSWQSYIDTLTGPKEDQAVERAAICGVDPPGTWASTKDFTVSPDEIKKLASGDQASFASSGVHLGGIKFMLVRNELLDPSFPCLHLRSSSYSATVGKTHKAYVVGIGYKDGSAGKVSQKVFEITNHLRSSQY